MEAKHLDRVARNELKTLTAENADRVAQHLVMAARLTESDPSLALQHAAAAADRAGRIGVVRETYAIVAYAAEDYALALRELRTYRRLTGKDDELALMIDSERALGRPEKALELGRSVVRTDLPVAVQVEVAIAMSGARLDLGQTEDALGELRIPQLDPDTAFEWSADLFAAYATVLEELGRDAEAADWWKRADIAAEAFDDSASDVIEIVEQEIEFEPEGAVEADAEASLPLEGAASVPADDGEGVHQAAWDPRDEVAELLGESEMSADEQSSAEQQVPADERGDDEAAREGKSEDA